MADLRAAEQVAREEALDAYAAMVERVAADKFPDTGAFASTLDAAGRTIDEFESAVQAARRVQGMRRRAETNSVEAAQTDLAEVGAEREAINAQLAGKLPSDEIAEQLDVLSARAMQARRRIDAARRDAAELERAERALRGSIRGEALPTEQAAPQPKFDVQVTSSATRAPKNYDPYDKRWAMRRGERGEVFYTFNGQRVSA
ncbi:MAG: hypothetical protein AAGI22_18375 [Planctomycetota bacterium]